MVRPSRFYPNPETVADNAFQRSADRDSDVLTLMARTEFDAAVEGLGVVLESEILAADELANGTLIAPFNAPEFEVETVSYYLVRSAEAKSRRHTSTFEAWLRAKITAANLRMTPAS